MPNKASEFFGIDFSSKEAPVQNTAQEAPKRSQKGFVQNALEFFGIDFSAPQKAPEQPKQVEPTTAGGNWDEINKRYAQGKVERDKAQLAILQGELASERNPRTRAIIQREIDRVTANTGNR